MKQRKAFTIIEVVLVLAIAGLIFLMVFIALPTLQRSQRNTRRHQDLARIATAVNDYQANNNSLPFPTTTNARNGVDKNFVNKYIDSGCKGKSANNNSNVIYFNGNLSSGTNSVYECTTEQFVDPDGTPYNIFAPSSFDSSKEIYYNNATNSMPNFEDNKHYIIALAKAKCGTENKAEAITGKNYFALFYLLEGGSVYCVDNQ